MTIDVVKDGDNQSTEAAPVVAVRLPTAGRQSIRDQRKQILDKLYLDLLVPRWHLEDEEGTRDVIIRYGPTRSAKVEASLKKRTADDHALDDASLLVHADLLTDSCIGVFQVLDGNYDAKYPLTIDQDGAPCTEPADHGTRSPGDGGWPKFDKQLAATLGLSDLEASRAVNIVRALYITDGDLIDASNRVSTWSTQANEDAEDDFTQP